MIADELGGDFGRLLASAMADAMAGAAAIAWFAVDADGLSFLDGQGV